MSGVDLWRLDIAVPQASAGEFTEALETLCGVVLVQGEDADPVWTLTGWTEHEPDRGRAQALFALLAAEHGIEALNLRIAPQEEKDWVAENLASFAPISAGRFFVHASHFDGPVPAEAIALVVDASVAFGTGEHASTRGCLLALDRLADLKPERTLDVGSGSGLLAMAAAKLWDGPVLATDIDPRAAQVAEANARLNGVGSRLTVRIADGYALPEIAESAPYGLILANILARPLIAMAADLARHLAPGGRAVLAGFLAADSQAVRDAHAAHDLHLVDRVAVDGWETLVLAR